MKHTPKPRKSEQPKDDHEKLFHYFHRISHDPNKSPSERHRAALDWPD